MFEKRLEIEKGGQLTLVEMAGNVALAAWDEADALIRLHDGQEEDLTVEESAKGPAISASESCEVWVPASVAVAIRQVAGNLKASGLIRLDAEQVRGNLKLDELGEAVLAEVYGNLKAHSTASLRLVGTVHGEASLSAVGACDLQNVRGNVRAKGCEQLRVSRIGGNLHARECSAALDVDQVGGNALLKGLNGALTLDRVAGNLVAKNLRGGAKVDRIGGNMVLNGELGTGLTYQFQADGNALLRLPEEASAHLTLHARGHLVSTVELADEERRDGTLVGTLGDGGAEIVVEAKGNVMLGGGHMPVGAGLSEEISHQVEESLRAIDLEAIGRQVGEEMEAAMGRLRVKLETADWDRVGVRTQEAIERAMERLQQDMERVADRAARQQEHLERRAEREAQHLERLDRKVRRAAQRQSSSVVEGDGPDWSATETAELAEPGPSLDTERISILRMVEQGQITPEEAEMLLDALE